jgi:hypothetical protein
LIEPLEVLAVSQLNFTAQRSFVAVVRNLKTDKFPLWWWNGNNVT